ncbi:MAG: DUF3854 domain-containing protein [Planctomycetes bacterium]|nr:DUF3854 domain-containing protein [Planctomycetota bacterium]
MTNLPLDERHLADLRKSGLSDETIQAAGLYSAKGDAIRDILGWQEKAGAWGLAMVFPYRSADGADTGYARTKPDFPRTNKDGKQVKYESPVKQQNRAYFPPGLTAAFASSPVIIVTEGEKKTLAAWQAGFCCIGLIGVWGFQKKRLRDDRGKPFGARQLIPDLQSLDWKGKQVVIAFDSDAADRHELQIAEYRLAEVLSVKECTVRVARIPLLSGDKTGLDDFLVHHGAEGNSALAALLNKTASPELPPKSSPMDIARIIVTEDFTGPTGNGLRYWREDFWRFNGICYELLSEKELTLEILQWLDSRGFKATPRQAAEVVACLASECHVPFAWNMPCWLDDEDHGAGWVAFPNGLFKIDDPANLKTTPHTARYFTPWAMEYAFDPEADCPVWLAFLNQVLDSDTERIDLLQRWFGLLLTPDTSYQKFLLLVGPPRAGKGTICRTLKAMIGSANCASPNLSGLSSRFGLSPLLTKTLAIVPDAHIGKHADSVRVAETLKSVVGEDPQDIDRKYRDQLNSVRLPTRFVISCNEIAHFNDPSGALAARVSAIVFRNSYQGQEDRTLEQRLWNELPGIVNWAIVGLDRLRAAGRLNEPEQCRPIVEDFRRLSSPTATFCDECVEFHPSFQKTTCDAAFAAWIGWCKANGHERGSKGRFGERLRSVNSMVERKRIRLDDDRAYCYQGIRLTQQGHIFRVEGERIQSESQ